MLAGLDPEEYTLDDDLSNTGVVNTPGNPVDWTMLKNVPFGFADGTDDGGESAVASGQSSTGIDPPLYVNYEVAHREFDAPSAGYVMAIASATIGINTWNSEDDARVTLGISERPNEFSDYAQEYEFVLPAELPTTYFVSPVTISALFEVDAGPDTLYFVVRNGGPIGCAVSDRQFTVLFIPTSFGPVDTSD